MMGEASASLGGWPPALIASGLAALVASLGILVVSFSRDWAQRYRPVLAALASGVLLSTALFILPEAFAGSGLAPLAALAGYFVLFLFSRFARKPEGRAFAAFFAIAAHSTIDGMEYGLLFSADMTAGILGAAGLILHEFSEGVILFLILRGVGIGKVPSALAAMFGAALTTPVGTLATLMIIPQLSPEMFSMALAFAAGALLFVGASQLPEEFGELGFRSSVVAYAFGALAAVLLFWATHSGHNHPPGEHPREDAYHLGDHDH